MAYKDSLPRRWLHCPRMSEELIMDKFLAFKTPMSSHYDAKMPTDYMFHPNQVFEHVKSVKRKMGLWIDLTNTERYFNRNEIEKNDCNYVKMMCTGHDGPPEAEKVQYLISTVAKFIKNHPDDIIGVQQNWYLIAEKFHLIVKSKVTKIKFSGFIIVAFMIEKMDFKVEAAISAFSKARPPGIYKEDYLKELYRRYASEADAPLAPALPLWYLKENDDSGTDHRVMRRNFSRTSGRKRPY